LRQYERKRCTTISRGNRVGLRSNWCERIVNYS
jgi:hypothetical protein